jgi:hypothetical protein
MIRKSFYVHLPSNAENDTFNNIPTNFVIKLPKSLEFGTEWSVGLSEILFPAIRNEEQNEDIQVSDRVKRTAIIEAENKVPENLEFPSNEVLQAMREIANIKNLTAKHVPRIYHLLIDENVNPKFKELFKKIRLLHEPADPDHLQEFFKYIKDISPKPPKRKKKSDDPSNLWFFEEKIFWNLYALFQEHDETTDIQILLEFKELFILTYQREIAELNRQRVEIGHYIYEISYYLFETSSPLFTHEKVRKILNQRPPKYLGDIPLVKTYEYLAYINELMRNDVPNNHGASTEQNMKILSEQCEKILNQAKLIHELINIRDEKNRNQLTPDEPYLVTLEKLKPVDIPVHGYDDAIDSAYNMLHEYAVNRTFVGFTNRINKWFDILMVNHKTKLQRLGIVFNKIQSVLKEWNEKKINTEKVASNLKAISDELVHDGIFDDYDYFAAQHKGKEYSPRRERIRVLIQRSKTVAETADKFRKKPPADTLKNKSKPETTSVNTDKNVGTPGSTVTNKDKTEEGTTSEVSPKPEEEEEKTTAPGITQIIDFPNFAKLRRVASNYIYVYGDIVEPQVVGNVFGQLLRVVNIPNPDTSHHIVFDNIHYINLSKRYFNQIEIQLTDVAGNPVKFDAGSTICTLHFQQKSVA